VDQGDRVVYQRELSDCVRIRDNVGRQSYLIPGAPSGERKRLTNPPTRSGWTQACEAKPWFANYIQKLAGISDKSKGSEYPVSYGLATVSAFFVSRICGSEL
jgi:hypothetical protein